MNDRRPLHRLFGLSFIDFFHGTSVDVDVELDMSVKQQFLDVLLIRKGAGPIPRQLPDGLELLPFNLVTFKSYREALDTWALCELIGHFVSCRKRFSPSHDALLPDADFRLFAVSARFPKGLADEVTLTSISQGVYEVSVLARRIRVIVINELRPEENNAMLLLFSAREELLQYAQQHYVPHSQETSTLLYELFRAYSEDPDMPDKLKEFVRQSIDELLKSLPAEERLKGLPAEERLKGLPAEERLKGLSAEELVRALPPEIVEVLARRLKANGSSSSRV
jgi:hypothetical protein